MTGVFLKGKDARFFIAFSIVSGQRGKADMPLLPLPV
jgi:hypothetical protein